MDRRRAQGHGLSGYRALAEFRHQIRRFLRFSEDAARKHGLEPQQHQLLLAIKGLPESCRPTIGQLAERMVIEHHSAVELVSRLEKLGAVIRTRSTRDRREVLVKLSPSGEDLLQRLTAFHESELETAAPHLISSLDDVLDALRSHGLRTGGIPVEPSTIPRSHEQTISEAPRRRHR